MDGGEFYSVTLRRIFKQYYGVEIGLYTHGSCFIPGSMHKYTIIGRYCSIAEGVRVYNWDHPVHFKSTHAFFFNKKLGYCQEDQVPYTPLTIGNDVWIGVYAVILPIVTHIGDGAVIGSGAVVNKNVPPYAIVVGNPSRVVRFRFPQEIIDRLLAEKWWEKDMDEVVPNLSEYQQPFEPWFYEHNPSAERMNNQDKGTVCPENRDFRPDAHT
jgi:virginiamycin A acetyltransferase